LKNRKAGRQGSLEAGMPGGEEAGDF